MLLFVTLVLYGIFSGRNKISPLLDYICLTGFLGGGLSLLAVQAYGLMTGAVLALSFIFSVALACVLPRFLRF